MKYALILFTLSLSTTSFMQKIYTFSTQANSKEWRIVNDGVMGGISKSSLVVTNAGHGKFAGHVSLANNGGFASIQLNRSIKLAEGQQFIVLRVKGDGKRYEFRLTGDASQYESYVHPFATSGEWENIRLPISEFYPQFRGRKLNIPNFNFKSIEQLTFLIANKQEEDFELLIDWIGLE
jgi:NADH dehydrogenase [ubiquinone] 1 alpha subcomplex assembly factor 1